MRSKTAKKVSLATGIIGLTALVVAWIVIIASIHATPWFKLSVNALSDMGREGAPARELFNKGLILVGLLGLSIPVFAVSTTRSPLGGVSAGVFLAAMTNLVLIGVFPEGTKPHFIVSVEFFVFKWLGALFYSLALMNKGLRATGLTGVLLFIVFALSLPIVHWPSTGVLEVTSIVLFTIWAFISIPSSLIHQDMMG